MKCPSCTSSNPDEYKFCQKCGANLPQVSACPSCGQGNPRDYKFCQQCGEVLIPVDILASEDLAAAKRTTSAGSRKDQPGSAARPEAQTEAGMIESEAAEQQPLPPPPPAPLPTPKEQPDVHVPSAGVGESEADAQKPTPLPPTIKQPDVHLPAAGIGSSEAAAQQPTPQHPPGVTPTPTPEPVPQPETPVTPATIPASEDQPTVQQSAAALQPAIQPTSAPPPSAQPAPPPVAAPQVVIIREEEKKRRGLPGAVWAMLGALLVMMLCCGLLWFDVAEVPPGAIIRLPPPLDDIAGQIVDAIEEREIRLPVIGVPAEWWPPGSGNDNGSGQAPGNGTIVSCDRPDYVPGSGVCADLDLDDFLPPGSLSIEMEYFVDEISNEPYVNITITSLGGPFPMDEYVVNFWDDEWSASSGICEVDGSRYQCSGRFRWVENLHDLVIIRAVGDQYKDPDDIFACELARCPASIPAGPPVPLYPPPVPPVPPDQSGDTCDSIKSDNYFTPETLWYQANWQGDDLEILINTTRSDPFPEGQYIAYFSDMNNIGQHDCVLSNSRMQCRVIITDFTKYPGAFGWHTVTIARGMPDWNLCNLASILVQLDPPGNLPTDPPGSIPTDPPGSIPTDPPSQCPANETFHDGWPYNGGCCTDDCWCQQGSDGWGCWTTCNSWCSD